MKTNYLVGLFACLSILVAACGSSSSNDDGNTQLKTEDEAFDSFCLNFPESSACQDIQQEGDNLGLDPYDGQRDDLYGGSTYDDGYGKFCGCENGKAPVNYRGQVMCERQQQSTYQREEVRFRYQKRGKKKKLGASYDYVDEKQSSTVYVPAPNNCYEEVGTRCNLSYGQNECNISNGYGNPVYAQCVQVPGTNYGYCQEQTLY